MSTMIRSFGLECADKDCRGITNIVEAHSHLVKAHDFLTVNALPMMEKLAKVSSDQYWGTNIKRLPVEYPECGILLAKGPATKHNFAEVVNMCATVERLLDVLQWAMASEFADYQVEICHPTTGSHPLRLKNGKFDNDLILVKDGHQGARFEISDIAGDNDGNHKEKRDLIGLGVLRKPPKGAASDFDILSIEEWPKDGVFLVVSKELGTPLLKMPSPSHGQRARRPWVCGMPPHCFYEKRFEGTHTVILEVKNGRD